MSNVDKNTIVACDGCESDTGHPRIYLKLSVIEPTVCPYCSKIFVL